MALMCSKEGTSNVLSKAFGYYIEAVKFMAKIGFNHDLGDDEQWTYMGPNCSKVTMKDANEKVLKYCCEEE